MFLIVSYDISVEKYAERGVNNDFPQQERCPHCKGVVALERHGFYWRNAIEGEIVYRLVGHYCLFM